MRVVLVFWCFLMLLGCAHIDKWDKVDKGLAVSALVLTIGDWAQTRNISRNPERFCERSNPVLSHHPQTQDVDLWFGGMTLAGLVVAHVLPASYRKVWLGGWVVMEGWMVVNNDGLGIGMRW
jgi:hypothetical protein